MAEVKQKSIDNERVFTQDDVVRVLKRLFNEQVKEFDIEFAPERALKGFSILMLIWTKTMSLN